MSKTELPKQQVLFFVDGELDPAWREELERVVQRTTERTGWSIGPPEFVDLVQDDTVSDEDVPTHVLGCVFEIHDARGARRVDHDTDLRDLADMEYMIEVMRAFSVQANCEIGLEIDDTYVGSILKGRLGDGLAEGLLVEWRRTLEVEKGGT